MGFCFDALGGCSFRVCFVVFWERFAIVAFGVFIECWFDGLIVGVMYFRVRLACI